MTSSLNNPYGEPYGLKLLHVRIPPGFAPLFSPEKPSNIHSAYYRKGKCNLYQFALRPVTIFWLWNLRSHNILVMKFTPCHGILAMNSTPVTVFWPCNYTLSRYSGHEIYALSQYSGHEFYALSQYSAHEIHALLRYSSTF